MVEFSGTSEAEVRGRWRKGTPLVISYKKRAINHATTSNPAASQASKQATQSFTINTQT